jgi:hypothetical protein
MFQMSSFAATATVGSRFGAGVAVWSMMPTRFGPAAECMSQDDQLNDQEQQGHHD